jgi:quinoprotein glucose dehydrogenase
VRTLATAAAVALLTMTAATAPGRRSWPDFGGDPASSHFVELDQIDKTNVATLEVAWFYPYATTGFNPIVVDEVMYAWGRNGSLIALDAASGKALWIHERLTGMTSRGVNFWQSADGKDSRLIFAINGYLQAIDARSGESIRTFGDNGIVDLRRGLARAEGTDRRVQSRSPGKVWKNLLIIGSASGEGFVTPPGDIRAYDIVTGTLRMNRMFGSSFRKSMTFSGRSSSVDAPR